MSTVGFSFNADPGELNKVLASQEGRVFGAAQAALALAAEQIAHDARASIADAGFSQLWQDSVGVRLFPGHRGGTITVSDSIPYASVFEKGATITGRPLLWLPLPSCPAKIAGKHATPKAYRANIGPLRYMVARGVPFLVGKAAATGVQSARTWGAHGIPRASANAEVPLFVGLSSVTIGKKFDVLGAVERAYAELSRNFSAGLSEG
jgi:hypothetical protein